MDALVLLARWHGRALDVDKLMHRLNLTEPLDGSDLVRAARTAGFRAKRVTRSSRDLRKIPLPAIFASREQRFKVLARISDRHALVLDAAGIAPSTVSLPRFLDDWTGELILVQRRASKDDEGKNFDYSWFIDAIAKHRTLLSEVLLASFVLQLFALITPLFFQVVIDKVLVHRGLTTLDVLAIGLLAVSVFEVLLGGLRTYVFSHTTNRVDVTLGSELFRHLLSLPISYFEARRIGDTLARVRELESVRQFITGSALTLLIDVLFTVVFLVVMLLYSPTLAYIVLGAIPLYVGLSLFIAPSLQARLLEKFHRGAENQAFLVEAIGGIETIKTHAAEPQSEKRWQEQLAGYVSASFKATSLANIANQSASLVNKATVVLILWVGARLVIDGELSVGQLVAFNMLSARVSGPVLRLVQLWQDFQQARISIARLGDILNTRPEPSGTPSRSSLPSIEGRVTFEHVSFRYRSDRAEVLHDVCMDIAPGEVIGIVGPSGSGKSTLTKLLQRFHSPQSGRILIDRIDLGIADPHWLRRSIGVVLQESFLFNSSVRDNIALGNPSLPMGAVVQFARLAGAHEFILELPDGYDTVVGEQGTTLSGGQRQRIAIARALVGNPRILIFDEATSALDYEAERVVQENMRAICRDRTVFIIAHRLTAIRTTHRIFVLDAGRVVEAGSHTALMRGRGPYARLHALQSHDVATG